MNKGHDRRRISLMLQLFVLMGIVQGCQRINTYKGYQIPDEISTGIWKLESDFCTSVMKKENLTAYELLSDSMAVYYDKTKLGSEFYRIGKYCMDYPFFAQSIYYQKATYNKALVKVRFDDEGIKPFEISFISNTKEAAVTGAILGDGENQSCMIMLFALNSNKWQIENLRIGFFMVEGKDANAWLKETDKWIEQKDYAMASYCTRMCGWLIKPANNFWHYDNEAEMLDQMEKLNRKIRRNLKPPHQLAEIDTKPGIQDISVIITNKKVFPGFEYNTKFSLDDSLAIDKECSKLDVVFANYFKNMEHDSIFVKIVHQEDPWKAPTKYLIRKRKLDKGLLTN